MNPVLDGDMATFMNIYLDMVNMMLNLIHFQRIGNWEGYLEAIREFLPYCFSLNRHNYARNLSYYYVHMLSLKKENLEAFVYLQKSGFCGSFSGRAHTMIPMEQMIEMTINRSSKETGGLSGKTVNVGATERWERIHHHMVAMRERLNYKNKKKQETP